MWGTQQYNQNCLECNWIDMQYSCNRLSRMMSKEKHIKGKFLSFYSTLSGTLKDSFAHKEGDYFHKKYKQIKILNTFCMEINI